MTSQGGSKMNLKWHLPIILFVCLCLSLTSVVTFSNQAYAFSDQVVQKGATGTDVIELQARLQYIGYYKGKIDGKFGWGTYWAVRHFQKAFGLKIDGLVGPNTRSMLSNHTYYNRAWVMGNINKGLDFTYYGGVPLKNQVKQHSSWHPASKTTSPSTTSTNNSSNSSNGSSKYQVTQLPAGYSSTDIQLLSNAVYGESRGEPFVGQVAVAAVILNRVSSAKFPDNVSGVIFQPGAFTAVQDGQIWLTPDSTAKKAVLDAINGWDPSHGALYYFNPNTATNGWIWGRPQIEKIGKHIFTK